MGGQMWSPELEGTRETSWESAQPNLASSMDWRHGWLQQQQETPEQVFDEAVHTLDPSEIQSQWKLPTLAQVSNFIRNLSTMARMGVEASVAGLAYTERFLACTGMQLTARNWRRLLLVCWLMASKVWDDESMENRHFAELSPLFTLDDINLLERHFVQAVGYDLSLGPSMYARYYLSLRAIMQANEKVFPMRPLNSDMVKKLEERSAAAQLLARGQASSAHAAHAAHPLSRSM